MKDRSSAIAAELHAIAEANNGKLRPVDVVEAARPKNSVLHSRFEWDDSEAAERYRLWQARQLISVTVEYFGAVDNQKSSRVFVSLESDRKTDDGYRNINVVMKDPSMREELLSNALDEMRRFQQRYKDLTELTKVFLAMNSVATKSKKKLRQREVAA